MTLTNRADEKPPLIYHPVDIIVEGGESRKIDAWRVSDIEGLVIHQNIVGKGWTVTHERTGRWLLRSIPDVDRAVHAVYLLSVFVDWGLSADEIYARYRQELGEFLQKTAETVGGVAPPMPA